MPTGDDVSASKGQLARVRKLISDEPVDAVDGVRAGNALQRLCLALTRALPAAGAGITVMIDHGTQGVAAASDALSSQIEELQFTLGEGPCIEANALQRPVLVADLDGDSAQRWPVYAPAAQVHGVRAVFAFPLQIGAAHLGVLDVYRDRPGPLGREALTLALTFAEVALSTMLDRQARTGPDEAARDLDDVMLPRMEVYQAQGMLQVQLGVSAGEALTRLRAHAYVHDRGLSDLARDVIDRRLCLERDT
jgi:GAF domain/ANTAR domain